MEPIAFVDLKRQQGKILPELERRMKAVLQHNRYIMGPEVEELEGKLAAYTGVKHCITVASGTDALLISLMALGIGPGDEVITTPFTFIATAETIVLLRAKPVFVDIDAGTYNIDPNRIASAVSPRTKAILPVSLFGQCADLDSINAIAAKHGIPVIEDGCQSFGATRKGRKSCALSTIGCTSFFPSKPLGCYGDGGACFTDSDDLASTMRKIRVHGQDRRYHHSILGVNGRMDTLQAAVLLAKLNVFPEEVEARGRIGARYTELFGQLGEKRIVTPFIEPGNTSVYAQYTVQVENRDEVQKRLANGAVPVPTAVHYPIPLHFQPAFADLDHNPGAYPISESTARRVMSLPMHPYLTEGALEHIVASVSKTISCNS